MSVKKKTDYLILHNYVHNRLKCKYYIFLNIWGEQPKRPGFNNLREPLRIERKMLNNRRISELSRWDSDFTNIITTIFKK